MKKGSKMTQEQKDLISQKTKEAMSRPEVKEKIINNGLNFGMKDRQEVRDKMVSTTKERYGNNNKYKYFGNNIDKYDETKDILFSKEDFLNKILEYKSINKINPSAIDLSCFIRMFYYNCLQESISV